ncbi:MAG: nucleoside kinase [Kiritimatiellia bacterium]
MNSKETITITFADGAQARVPVFTEVRAILRDTPEARDGLLIGAYVNHEPVSLDFTVPCDSQVRPLTTGDPDGLRMYERSVSFLLGKAVQEAAPESLFSLDYAMGPGIYCSFRADPGADPGISPEKLAEVEAIMRRDVAANLPIKTTRMAFDQAVRHFQNAGRPDTVELLEYHNPPYLVIYTCGAASILPQGPLMPSTGGLGFFRLEHYPPGFVLQLPDPDLPLGEAPPFKDQPHLFRIFQEHKQWGRILGLNTAGRLNALTSAGGIGDFIKISESLHERKVADIADEIARRGSRLVLVAGPSSAGKTTFSKRLAIQLRVCGLHPVNIEMDNYFKDQNLNTPLGPDGKPDFEHFEALDLDLFNRQMLQLIAGLEIEPPRFDFPTKRQLFGGAKLKLDPAHVLIVEGIHGLNPSLTGMMPEESVFRVYVNALSQLCLDATNRISTTDNRLIRRMVRDARFRGHTAVRTLRLWSSVRRGEKRWVFPYQQNADATFNSALDYELAVLKTFAEPLLVGVKPTEPEYAAARRLGWLLKNFMAVPDREVPPTSLLREYIGNSTFSY